MCRCRPGNTSSPACSRIPQRRVSVRGGWAERGKPLRPCSPRAECNGLIRSCSRITRDKCRLTSLDHSLDQSRRVGLMVNYSETHDNERLAAGRPGLAAQPALRVDQCERRIWFHLRGGMAGGTEKIKVHGSAGMDWGGQDNLVPELSRLNRLFAGTPLLFRWRKADPADPADSPVYALLRQSEQGEDEVLVLVNTDVERPQKLVLPVDRRTETRMVPRSSVRWMRGGNFWGKRLRRCTIRLELSRSRSLPEPRFVSPPPWSPRVSAGETAGKLAPGRHGGYRF